jgi:hypothetical protein
MPWGRKAEGVTKVAASCEICSAGYVIAGVYSVGCVALWLADLAFKIDFRFGIVALNPMSAKQFPILLRNPRDLACRGRHGHAGGAPII